MLEKEKENLIFGLDIGTRTIIGIVGYKQEKEFIVVASEVIEHESRAMVDGQIHDIIAVARSAKKVKEGLEEKLGIVLEEVAIAAAGRVLKTLRVSASQEFEEQQTINSFMINSLELQGIKEAQRQISNSELGHDDGEYFYVGHSVVNYYLNQYNIANLEAQKGLQIGADILATFLPKLVVESLYTVMEKVGLTVINITLEPIAAMNAVIPPNLRMLNLALVDIGAGTSDIAITKDGSVVAYGMIPLAGDEVTEKLVHTYLVDFETAENIKQQLSTNTIIEFEDIIGISHKVAAEDINQVIKEVIETLVTEIASKITELNGESSPSAVFCVGGGSQISYMTTVLAEQLAMPTQRVSIRSNEHATMVIDEKKEIRGPESITPLGICLTTMEKKENDFVSIKVNGKMVKLLHTKKMTIADAAIAIDLDHNQIISVRGKTLMFKLNEERIRIKGEVGTQPRIMSNNKEATLETAIAEGDNIMIYPAQNGEDGHVNIIDLIHQTGLSEEEASVIVNGQVVDHLYEVENGDEIIIEKNLEVGTKQVIKEEVKQEKLVHVIVNGQVVSMEDKENLIFVTIFDYIDFDLSKAKGNIVLKLNGSKASYTDILKDGDKIDVYWDENNI